MGIIDMGLSKEILLANKIELKLKSGIKQLYRYDIEYKAESLIDYISELFEAAEEYNSAGFEPKIELERYMTPLKKHIEDIATDIKFDIIDGVQPPFEKLNHLYRLIGLSREFNKASGCCRIDSDRYLEMADILNDRAELAAY